MNRIPPFLKPGDLIGITCPAGAVNDEDMHYMYTQLEAWGFKLVIGETVGTNYNKFSATDEKRTRDLQRMLDDTSIKAILFGRGGYGVVRIIDSLDFTVFNNAPKWLLGYSDITCIHSHVHTQYQVASIHAHMQSGYKPDEYDEASTQSIYDTLTGKKIEYTIPSHTMNRLGICEAELVGGNLALLSDLIGTKSDIDTKGKILFIEEIGEYKYNIDRMLWQLLRAGKLDALAGLIIGGFTNTQDNETPFGMSEYEIVWEKIEKFNYPVCFDFPVGHQTHNLALKCGANYRLTVSHDKVELIEF